jgi:hypothetical protein
MRLRVLPAALLRILGLVNPTLQAVREELYQLRRPFVVDHAKFARTFGADVTPHPDAIRATSEWYAAKSEPCSPG